jgi:hypothetical protein
MLPGLMTLSGSGTSFALFSTTVEYTAATSAFPVIALPPFIWGPEAIWQLIAINPTWLAGATGDADEILTVTVTTGTEVVSDTVTITNLPFLLDEQ